MLLLYAPIACVTSTIIAFNTLHWLANLNSMKAGTILFFIFVSTIPKQLQMQNKHSINIKGVTITSVIKNRRIMGILFTTLNTILRAPDWKSQPIGKDPDAGKYWGQEERGVAKDEMVGCHHWLSGHEFEQTLGDSEGHGSPACCNPRGHQESDNWTTIYSCRFLHVFVYPK